MRALLTLLAFAPLSALAGSLNDMDQDACYDGANRVPCNAANTGNAAACPRQDGRFGRDAAATAGQLPKVGASASGFDFTPLDASGNAIPIVGGVPISTPTGVFDNTTGLLWEVKTADNGMRDKDWTYNGYDGSTGSPDPGSGMGSDNSQQVSHRLWRWTPRGSAVPARGAGFGRRPCDYSVGPQVPEL